MHNLDRTVREMGDELEFASQEFNPELGDELNGAFEMAFNGQGASPLAEIQELELATELLTVSNEAELDHFLSKIMRKGGGGSGGGGGGFKRFFNSPLGSFLKKGLGKLAPIAGTVVGGMFGGPLGAKLGGKIGSGAARLFNLELEGLSAEDQEFEVARAYVRFASDAARRAAVHAQRGMPPREAAQKAIAGAARQHAPGLLDTKASEMYEDADGSSYAPPRRPGLPTQGRWVRHGRRIYIHLQ